MKDCPFCDQKQHFRHVAEAGNVFVMYPKGPACKCHVLIIPKRHVAHFDKLNSKEVLEMHSFVKQLVEAAKSNLPDFIGYNLLSNNGSIEVRQHVQHCHLHLFLRTASEPGDPVTDRHEGAPPDLSKEDIGSLNELKSWFTSKD